ncbi:MAG: cytochrome c biogenesis protein CcdA, partial [Chloroflexota bacterium]
LIFALGWTACVGPILGSILTLLLVEGSTPLGVVSLLAGGLLAVVYVLGLGLPIFLVVFLLLGGQARGKLGRLLRGRGWELRLGRISVVAHSTSVISGVMLIALGVLLLTGQMTALSAWLAQSPLTDVGLAIEQRLDRIW